MDALPPELLREIFHLALPILPRDLKDVPLESDIMWTWFRSSEDPLPALRQLSSVCTLWRDIINNFPSAWSKVFIRPPNKPPLEEILAKSRNAPLDLIITCNKDYPQDEATEDVKEQMKSLAKFLQPFRSRIRVLDQCCRHTPNCFLPHFLADGDPLISFPSLKSLMIGSILMAIPHEILNRQQYVDAPNLERLYLASCPQFEDILTPRSMSKIQHFLASPHTGYHPLVSNKALRLGSCSLLKLEYLGGEQSNFMGIEPGSVLRFPNMTEMHLTYIRMDVSNWDFLDRIDSPKLRVLVLEKTLEYDPPTDEIIPFLLGDMTPRLFSTVTSLSMKHFTIDRAGLKTIMKACPQLEYLILPYCQFTSFSDDDSVANDRLFGVNMIHVSVDYCDISANTLRALLVNILQHRARHTGNVPCKLALYLTLYLADRRLWGMTFGMTSWGMPEVLESSEFQDVLFTRHVMLTNVLF
ncbi:hypothetical protein M422DRAFT_36412, partial [Sphaerobolus stellatus SS14]